MENHYFNCQCTDFNHIFRFVYDPKDNDMWLEVHLYNWMPWYKRVWAAIRFIFKMEPAYGHYDTTIIRPEDIKNLQNLIDRYNNEQKQQLLNYTF